MLLLIPGPVTTRPEVRAALAQDFAPWDNDFRPIYLGVRTRLLRIAGGQPDTHVTLALQGCGHFITEAAVRSFLPPGGKILIPATGAYADRMIRLATEAGRQVIQLPIAQTAPTDPRAVAAALAADPTITHVGLVYSETGSGVIHDVPAVGAAVRAAGRRLIVDAVSAFGALPFDISAQPEVDAVVFTSNKCLECVPGVAFAVARIDRLLECAGQRGKLVVRPGRHLRAQPAHRRRQLPLHPARAGAECAHHRARPVRRRGRPAGPPGALHRQYAGALRRRDRPRPDAPACRATRRARWW